MKTSLWHQMAFVALTAQLSWGTASAATELFPVDVGAEAPDTVSLGLPGFNKDLGVLTGVTFYVDLQETLGLVVSDGSKEAQAFTDGVSTDTLKITGPDNTTLLSHIYVSTPVSDVLPGGGTRSYAPTEISYMTAPGPLTDLLAYEVVGTKDLPFAVGLSAVYSGIPDSLDSELTFNGASSISGGIFIDYTYTPLSVPEPATWTLLLAGLGVLALWRRQRATLPAEQRP